MTRRSLFLLAAAAGLVAAAPAQVGEFLPRVKLKSFRGTEAQSLQDFFGRTLLIEYFAYW